VSGLAIGKLAPSGAPDPLGLYGALFNNLDLGPLEGRQASQTAL
jgi:hypothetical protein